jgi:hypothetical protein
VYKQDGSLADLFTPRLARETVRQLADAAGARALEHARELAPVYPADRHHPPGTLRDSYRQSDVERVNDGVDEGYASGVQSSWYIARFIELGTKAHDEDPESRLAVAFTTTDGEKVKAHVRNPGFAGKFVVRRAMLLTELEFEEIGTPIVERWARRQEAAARR